MLTRILSRLQLLSIKKRLLRVRVVVCDVDGVLTDGGLYYSPCGSVAKRFDVRDGLAIRMLERAGITVVFMSGGGSGAVEQRASNLGIKHCYAGIRDKSKKIHSLSVDLGIKPNQIIYLGDDLNDLVVRPLVGLLVVPSDAVNSLRMRADWVLTRPGGHGAVRELADHLLSSQGLLQKTNISGWYETND